MGDSWEDEDFVPAVPQAVVLPSKSAWDDEDAVCDGVRRRCVCVNAWIVTPSFPLPHCMRLTAPH